MHVNRQFWIATIGIFCAVATSSGALAQQSRQEIGTRPYYLDRLAIAPPEIKARLAKLAEEGEARGWTFQTGYTSAADIPIEQLTGLRVPADALKRADVQNRFAAEALRLDKEAAAAAGEAEPTSLCRPSSPAFDWKDAGEITSVKNQNPCGTCWIFSALGAYEASYHIRNKETIDGSEQQVMQCVEKDNKKVGSCMKGGWFAWVFDWNISNGIANESDVPYTGKEGACNQNVAAPYTSTIWGFVSKTVKIPPVQQIKQAICEHGSVAVAVNATQAFKHYTGGVFNEHDPGKRVNHGVLLTGWDDAKQAWHMKNSWGPAWGQRGWMWIKYDSNLIGMLAAWVRAKSKNYSLSPQLRALYEMHFAARPAKPVDAAVAARAASSGLDGAWLLSDGEGTLEIAGSEWWHPDKGVATLSRGREASDYEVTYRQHQGVKCAYRITKAADGRILTLEAADATQLPEYCPSGKLLRAD